jgi:putative sterol carrier protein
VRLDPFEPGTGGHRPNVASTPARFVPYHARREDDQEASVSDKYPFLSDEWFEAADKLIKEHSPGAPPAANILMNLEVADAGKTIAFHMGSKDGGALFGKGHQEGADLTLSTDIDTAKAVFVSGDQQAGMQAFMSGKVRVQGDMTKLMMAQAQGGGPNQALTQALQDITA